MSIENSQFLGNIRSGVLPSEEEVPAVDDTTEQPEGHVSETPEAAAAPVAPSQPDLNARLALAEKRLKDSQDFIKTLLNERRPAPEQAQPAGPTAVQRLTELGIPAEDIRAIAEEVAAAAVEARVSPREKAMEADVYMAQRNAEYVKSLPAMVDFLASNEEVNLEVQELVSAGKPLAARLLAWAYFQGDRAQSAEKVGVAEAAEVQAKRDAAKAQAQIIPGNRTARNPGEAPKMSPAQRVQKAQEIAAATGDKRALVIETTRALWGDRVADIAKRRR